MTIRIAELNDVHLDDLESDGTHAHREHGQTEISLDNHTFLNSCDKLTNMSLR